MTETTDDKGASTVCGRGHYTVLDDEMFDHHVKRIIVSRAATELPVPRQARRTLFIVSGKRP